MTWNPLTRLMLAIIVFSISLVGTAWYAHSKGEQSGIATTQAAWTLERLAIQTAKANLEAKNRQTEQELIDAQEKHGQEVAALNIAVAAAADRARAASAGLRNATQAAAERARAQCANPAIAELRETADDPVGLLADVLGRADERAVALARIADDRGLAGRACERLYDEAREALKE